eukprot:COSAG03_NODE_2009_length_3227_cov_4.238171_3_plen_309_part_00
MHASSAPARCREVPLASARSSQPAQTPALSSELPVGSARSAAAGCRAPRQAPQRGQGVRGWLACAQLQVAYMYCSGHRAGQAAARPRGPGRRTSSFIQIHALDLPDLDRARPRRGEATRILFIVRYQGIMIRDCRQRQRHLPRRRRQRRARLDRQGAPRCLGSLATLGQKNGEEYRVRPKQLAVARVSLQRLPRPRQPCGLAMSRCVCLCKAPRLSQHRPVPRTQRATPRDAARSTRKGLWRQRRAQVAARRRASAKLTRRGPREPKQLLDRRGRSQTASRGRASAACLDQPLPRPTKCYQPQRCNRS